MEGDGLGCSAVTHDVDVLVLPPTTDMRGPVVINLAVVACVITFVVPVLLLVKELQAVLLQLLVAGGLVAPLMAVVSFVTAHQGHLPG